VLGPDRYTRKLFGTVIGTGAQVGVVRC